VQRGPGGVDEVFAAQGYAGGAALQAGGVHQLAGEPAQVVVGGRLRQAADPLHEVSPANFSVRARGPGLGGAAARRGV
jgi:hypothetical protein